MLTKVLGVLTMIPYLVPVPKSIALDLRLLFEMVSSDFWFMGFS